MKTCKRCGANIDIENHHIHPKFMNNPKGYGEKVDLCKNGCHLPLHIIISSILWKYINDFDKIEAIDEVKKFTENYIGNYYKKEKIKEAKILNDIDNGTKICKNCERELDIEDEYCDGCDSSQPKEED